MALQSGVALASWGPQAACSWELSWEDKVGDSGSLWPKVPENKINPSEQTSGTASSCCGDLAVVPAKM